MRKVNGSESFGNEEDSSASVFGDASKAMTHPWLSLLIPSYEYAEGVQRILGALPEQLEGCMECVVSDDSNTNGVKEVVEAHNLGKDDCAKVRYLRNTSKHGAVSNWNRLLREARGEYVLLMHHDECPNGNEFFDRLWAEVQRFGYPDVLILGCFVGTESKSTLRRHMPSQMQEIFLKLLGPDALIRHNVIGPPSVFVVKRKLCPSFDEQLKWLVDVDWMRKILAAATSMIHASSEVNVISLQREAESITASLKDGLTEIKRLEIEHLAPQIRSQWLKWLLQPQNTWQKIASEMETVLWVGVRACLCLQARLTSIENPTHRRDAQR